MHTFLAQLNITSRGKSITANTTSASVDMGAASASDDYIIVYNPDTTHVVFVRTDTSAPTAVTTDAFVPPGQTFPFMKPRNHTYAAAIYEAGGSGTVRIMTGKGP